MKKSGIKVYDSGKGKSLEYDMQEQRREIEEILDRIEKCTCETDLIKLRRELDHLITRFCNRKISELVKTI